jgi:hypothetical protein
VQVQHVPNEMRLRCRFYVYAHFIEAGEPVWYWLGPASDM